MNQTEWKTINHERGELITKGIESGLTAAETARLDELQRIADQHLDEVAPRSTAALEKLENMLMMTQTRANI